MYDMQYVRIETKADNMEFIINRSPEAPLSPITIIEAGHSKPKRGKRADEVSVFRQLHVVTGGEGLFKGRKICAGDAFLVVPGDSQDMSVESDGFEQFWINFDGTSALRLLHDCGIPNESQILDLGEDEYGRALAVSLLEGIFEGTPSAQKPKHKHAYLVGVLYQLLSLCGKAERRVGTLADGYVASVCSYIRSHYSEPLTVEWLAAVAGLSPKYLIRIFKKVTGMTVVTYITETRLGIAASLLEATDRSVSDIARSVGFADPLYFSRVFKKAFGVAPREYRENEEKKGAIKFEEVEL